MARAVRRLSGVPRKEKAKRFFYLYVKPKRAPKWWPRVSLNGVLTKPVQAAYVGVLKDGAGWRIYTGDKLTAKEVKLARQLVEVPKPCMFQIVDAKEVDFVQDSWRRSGD